MAIDLIPIRDLKAEGVRLSPATIWRMVKCGRFPKPVYPSPGKAAWVKSEVEAWKAEVVAARDAEATDGSVSRQAA